jgi:hypothetical protein
MVRRPDRLNNAGVCYWCCELGCDSVKCKAYWQVSQWIVCPECSGTEWHNDDMYRHCGCFGGVVEVGSDPPD